MKRLVYFILIVTLATSGIGCMRAHYVSAQPHSAYYNRPPAPGRGYTWIDGDYYWRGGRYQYRNGYWARPRAGRSWHSGAWVNTRRGYYWRRGGWH